MQQAIHQLRTDRRDPVHGGEEGRQPRALEAIADRVEATLQDRQEKEISTNDIGAFVMEELKKLDKVAYVRFASVYRHFRDINEFANELKDLLNPKE
jgi:transcriptional repressor NrdR